MKKLLFLSFFLIICVYGFSQNYTPTITITPSIICTGGSGIATVNSGTTVINGYTWAPSSGNVTITTINSPAPNITCNTPGVYQLTLTSVSGANSGSATVQFTVEPTPTITIVSTSTLLCPGYSATLTGGGATNYTWLPGGTNGNTLAITPTSTQTYTLIGQTGSCISQTFITIPYNALGLNVGLNISGSPNICPGGNATLTATGATNYTWSPPFGLSTVNGSVTVVNSPTACITYSVVGETGTCGGSNNITICPGNDLAITVSPGSGVTCVGAKGLTLTASGATNYSWTPTTGLSLGFGPIVVATPSVSTCYTVVGTAGTCSGVAVACFTISPPPDFTVTPTATAVCVGSCYTYSATGLSTYTWSPSFTLSADTGMYVTACPTVTTIYTITAQSALGCLALPRLVTLTVVPVPTVTFAPVDRTVCVTVGTPGTTTLGVNVSPPPFGFLHSYTWAATPNIIGSPNQNPVLAQANYTVFNTTTTTYTVYVSYSALPGCVSKGDTITIRSINCDPPKATINTLLKNDTICAGGCVTFSWTPFGGAPVRFKWEFLGGTPATDTSLFFASSCFPAPGDYTVSLRVENRFGADSVIRKNYIRVVDIPNTTATPGDTCIKIGQSVQLNAIQAKGYVWSPGNTLSCTKCPNPIATPTVNTTYIVTGYNSLKCKYNDTVRVCVINDCGDMFVPNAFSPNDDGNNDVLYVRGKCLLNLTFQIFNRWGQKVFETEDISKGWDGRFNGERMNTGIFVYRLEGTTLDNKPFSMKGNITLIR